MSDRKPYSRVYWSILDDEKFDGVRHDMSQLGTWTLLLVVADMSYPSPAFLPPVPKKALAALAEVGLVDLLSGGRYRMHGLKAERDRRAAAATRTGSRGDPSGTQAGPNRDPDGSQGKGRGEDEAKDEDEDTARASDADAVVHYANLTGSFPSPKATGWIDDLAKTYGTDPTIAALAKARADGASGIIGRAQNILRAEARELSRNEREAEAAKVQERRVDGMLSRRVEWYRNTGKWDPAWGNPPSAA